MAKVRKVGLLFLRGCASEFVRANKREKDDKKGRERERRRRGWRRGGTYERGRCSGSYGREYVRQITYYDALLYTNTNTYRRGPVCRYMGVDIAR